ncbi:MAG: hypothetical protein ACJASB_000551 [Shewanella psychromarinicola]|jgi:hypothetical protein
MLKKRMLTSIVSQQRAWSIGYNGNHNAERNMS